MSEKPIILSKTNEADEAIMEAGNRLDISWWVSTAHQIEGETLFEFNDGEERDRVMAELPASLRETVSTVYPQGPIAA